MRFITFLDSLANSTRSKIRVQNKSRAFTLLELLAVIFIVSLLFSFIIPAAFRARETAHTMACANNLRQIGQGLYQFEANNQRLPGLFWGLHGKEHGKAGRLWSFSPSSKIAASLGGDALAQQVKFGPANPPFDPDWTDLNLTAPDILHCPSDSMAYGQASSYRYCRGTTHQWPDDSRGSFVTFIGKPLNTVTDGLSTTAFASERLISEPTSHSYSSDRSLISLPDTDALDISVSCSLANTTVNHSSFSKPAGNRWLSGRWLHSAYYHFFPPNSDWYDCVDLSSIQRVVVTARSNHDEGVNVLFGDGHVSFITNRITLAVWQALATRNGNEHLDPF